MRKVAISEVRSRGYSYELMTPVPLDTQLQRAIRLGLAGTAAAVPVGLLVAPILASLVREGFFWFLADVVVLLLAFLRSPLGIGLNVVALVGYALLWHESHGLQSATKLWHQVAFGLAIVGAIDLLIMGLPVLLVVLNLAVWVLLIALAIGLALLILGGAAVVRG